MQSAEVPAAGARPHTFDKGLKPDAIGFVDSLVIGLASTAPAYSLAAVIGSVVVIAGVQSPAVLFASFVPMVLIASAFYYMNKVDTDAGTTFSWVTRGLGPYPGWMGGWAICTTGILVVGSLADVAARYLFLLVGWDSAAEEKWAVMGLAIAMVAVMTLICVLGTELSAKVQNAMILIQVGSLLLFAAVALIKVYSGDGPSGSIRPSLSWLNPFEIPSSSALTAGLLIGVFIYWGWESSVNLAEETTDPAGAPGKAAVLSTVILLVTYVSVTIAVVAFAGLETLAEYDDDESVLGTLAGDVLGSPLDKLVVLAIVTSALASTQTTIIPASRTTLSMARAGAMPESLGRVHPRYYTPHISTWLIGALAVAYYAIVNAYSENVLFDTLSALSLMIAFYYALTGIACAVYWRHQLTKSVKNLLFIGIGPLIGAAILMYLFVKSVIDLSDPENSYTGDSWLGVGPPLAIGLGFLVLGAILMVVWRLRGIEPFFSRRLETVDAELAAGRAAEVS